MTPAALEDIVVRYPGRWLRGYTRGKLRRDPVYAAAFELLKDSPLPVLDVGCGIGLFACYLRERGCAMPVRGIDPDAAKIERARAATARYDAVEFEVADAAAHPGLRGNVVIFDVLHYLASDVQRALLARCAEMLPVAGACIIRTTPRDASWRFRVTAWQERLLTACGWMKTSARHYPTIDEVAAPFHARGLAVEVRPLWGRTPFNSYLFVVRPPAV